jgi:urocanate hydratase
VEAINQLAKKGMYFWDYGNAFLLEAKRAGAAVTKNNGDFIYPSYVQDIMGPLYFDYGFGPFRWVCTSGKPKDLEKTDKIAAEVLTEIEQSAPEEIKKQLNDNIHWIKEAGKNKLVVGSQARILYADCNGRTKIAKAFNDAIKTGEISAPIVLGRDHHDVSGTDSPYRETSNIYDGSHLPPTWQFKTLWAIVFGVLPGFRYTTAVELAGEKLLMEDLVLPSMVQMKLNND